MTTRNKPGMLEGIIKKAVLAAAIFAAPCAVTSCDRGDIEPSRPRADCVITPEKGEAPQDTLIDATNSTGNGARIEKYSVDFGDGAGIYEQTRSTPNSEFGKIWWIYTRAGDFIVTVTAIDSNGNYNRISKERLVGHGEDKAGALDDIQNNLEGRSYRCTRGVTLQIPSTKYGQVFSFTADIKAENSGEVRYYIYNIPALTDVEREVIDELKTEGRLPDFRIIEKYDSPNTIKGKTQ